eukprot:11877391-Prorocentrum_lima.AAC.1
MVADSRLGPITPQHLEDIADSVGLSLEVLGAAAAELDVDENGLLEGLEAVNIVKAFGLIAAE